MNLLPQASQRLARIWWRRTRPSVAQLRLWSGLVLFTFATTHLLNHALGLISIEAMQAAQDIRLSLTRSLIGTLVLCLAALVHFGLGIAHVVRLRTWRIGLRSVVQVLFAAVIPVLLIRHVIGTRGVVEMFGVSDDYSYALWAMWPGESVRLALLITLVWCHGCIGLHMWLSPKPWYRRSAWALNALAVLIPALAYAGYASAARMLHQRGDVSSPFSAAQYAEVQHAFLLGSYSYLAILVGAVAVWLALQMGTKMGARLTVRYAYGPAVTATQGLSVLEISQMNRIPHAAVCGGRARCSTCRVRVLEGLEHLPPISAAEQQVLRRVGAPANVRLACQLRPTADLTISTLLPANLETGQTSDFDKYHWGVEREVTLLFCDLRGFTHMSEGRLSFDVVFLLNQFLGRMAEAIEDSGGFVDKFMGDGIMAIFGMETTPAEGARRAIAAARAMGGVLDSLNQTLHEELRFPLSMGIGIHSGPAILGRIGAAHRTEAAAGLTALGETVNIASRLEQKTKDLAVQVAVSSYALNLSGLAANDKTLPQTVEIRGLSQPLDILVAARATNLPQPV
ncbi:adenylate/guanylate cyclase domain-containing protein [Cypionkella sinensis]|uniref:Adenylate/guanylate cyclase domain-containing protein n=1 Tax=Cypionkella sinensis TaxID=1756043 RepID=A0ABV7IZK0_9RHOB